MVRLSRRGIILSLFINGLNISLYLIILISACLNIIEATVNFIILNACAASVACLLIVSEIRLPQLTYEYFKFLCTYRGRGMSYIFFGCLVASPIAFNLYGGIIVVCMGIAFFMLSFVTLIPPLDGLILNYKRLDQWKEQKHFRVQLEAQRIYEQQLQQEQNLARLIPAATGHLHSPNAVLAAAAHAHAFANGSPKPRGVGYGPGPSAVSGGPAVGSTPATGSPLAGPSTVGGAGGGIVKKGGGSGMPTVMFSPPMSPARRNDLYTLPPGQQPKQIRDLPIAVMGPGAGVDIGAGVGAGAGTDDTKCGARDNMEDNTGNDTVSDAVNDTRVDFEIECETRIEIESESGSRDEEEAVSREEPPMMEKVEILSDEVQDFSLPQSQRWAEELNGEPHGGSQGPPASGSSSKSKTIPIQGEHTRSTSGQANTNSSHYIADNRFASNREPLTFGNAPLRRKPSFERLVSYHPSKPKAELQVQSSLLLQPLPQPLPQSQSISQSQPPVSIPVLQQQLRPQSPETDPSPPQSPEQSSPQSLEQPSPQSPPQSPPYSTTQLPPQLQSQSQPPSQSTRPQQSRSEFFFNLDSVLPLITPTGLDGLEHTFSSTGAYFPQLMPSVHMAQSMSAVPTAHSIQASRDSFSDSPPLKAPSVERNAPKEKESRLQNVRSTMAKAKPEWDRSGEDSILKSALHSRKPVPSLMQQQLQLQQRQGEEQQLPLRLNNKPKPPYDPFRKQPSTGGRIEDDYRSSSHSDLVNHQDLYRQSSISRQHLQQNTQQSTLIYPDSYSNVATGSDHPPRTVTEQVFSQLSSIPEGYGAENEVDTLVEGAKLGGSGGRSTPTFVRHSRYQGPTTATNNAVVHGGDPYQYRPPPGPGSSLHYGEQSNGSISQRDPAGHLPFPGQKQSYGEAMSVGETGSIDRSAAWLPSGRAPAPIVTASASPQTRVRGPRSRQPSFKKEEDIEEELLEEDQAMPDIILTLPTPSEARRGEYFAV